MNRKKMLIAVLAIALLVGLVSAGILTYYGRITTTATIGQSVLLDGEDITGMPITETINAFGGCRYCYKHILNNRACEPETVVFETTYNPLLTDDEIKTRIYELSEHELVRTEGSAGWGGPLFDFVTGTYTDAEWGSGDWTLNWDPLIVTKKHHKNCDLEFVIEPPTAGIENPPGNFWIEVDTDNSGENDEGDFIVSWHENPDESVPLGNHWRYREHTGSGWTDYLEPLPSWLDLSKDGEIFHIRIASDHLGNNNGRADDCGLPYGFALFMVVPGPEGFLGGNLGGSVIIPVQGDGDTYFVEETLGTLVTEITIPSDETVLFCICYKFAVTISPGTYTIKTEIKPA